MILNNQLIINMDRNKLLSWENEKVLGTIHKKVLR